MKKYTEISRQDQNHQTSTNTTAQLIAFTDTNTNEKKRTQSTI